MLRDEDDLSSLEDVLPASSKLVRTSFARTLLALTLNLILDLGPRFFQGLPVRGQIRQCSYPSICEKQNDFRATSYQADLSSRLPAASYTRP